MKMNVAVKAKGRYRLSVCGADGQAKRETPWFDNLITDNGLDLMYSGGYLSACAVGTSNAAPAVTDAQLGALLASTTNVSRSDGKNIATSPYYLFQVATFEFGLGDVVGNVAEVGVGSNATNLFSRALIEDSGGNPTTITVLSDEILRVEYELRVSIPEVDTSGTFDIDGTTYTWTGRASDIDSSIWQLPGDGPRTRVELVRFYEGGISSITGVPSGASNNSDSTTSDPYIDGDHAETFAAMADLSTANFAGGVGALWFRCGVFGSLTSAFQIGFSPKIPKTATEKLTVTVTHSWGRA